MRAIPFITAALIYSALAVQLIRGLSLTVRVRQWLLISGTAALVAHLMGMYIDARAAGGVHLQFAAALSWVAAAMVSVFLLASTVRAIERLGAVVFPISAATCVLVLFSDPPRIGANIDDWRIALHAILALVAFATLVMAALVAVMLGVQDRALRMRHFGPWTRGAPPLTQVEALLFQLITAGFALLSLALVTGVVFVHDLFAQHLVHKTVLTIAAWWVFGILLFGRWRFGWRGQRAIRMVLAGVVLLALAYLGSKFVLEVLLQRAP